MIRTTILSIALAFSCSIFAATPTHPCRVKNSSMREFATVENNAGCVVHRVNTKTSDLEFLLVYVDKGETDRGWGIPGGKPASKKNDMNENEISKALASRSTYEYSEPAVCTAGRETYEETGIEVVVEDLIEKQPKFLAFHCAPVEPKLTEGVAQAVDIKEIKRTAWASLEQIKRGNFKLRFESNLPILEKAQQTITGN